MKIKFDSTQEYQIQAVSSFIDLFDGQPLQQADYSIEINPTVETIQGSMFRSEMGIGNNLVLSNDTLLKNIQTVQERNDLSTISKEDFEKNGLNFSSEMETGTGKTYVYLRSIFELSQKYGLKNSL